jgi:hypothetical protein
MNVVKLIDNSDECNINQFMRCAFKDDLSVLIVSGKPSLKQLKQAWQNIIEEFNDISGQSAQTEELVLMRQIQILEDRIEAMRVYIEMHRTCALSKELPIITNHFTLFHKYGYPVAYTGDKKDFLEQLNDVEHAEQSYIWDLESLKEELKTLQAKNDDINPTATDLNFLQQIQRIELFHKFSIDFEKYSVKRLAILIKDFRELSEKLNNSMN